jgi:competence protein ComGC
MPVEMLAVFSFVALFALFVVLPTVLKKRHEVRDAE